MSQDELEQEYLRKATEYISVLPPGINNSAHAIKTVGVKLQNAYTPDTRTLSHNEVEKLQACYVFAVVTYANKKVKLIPGPLTGDFVKKVLRDSNGVVTEPVREAIQKELGDVAWYWARLHRELGLDPDLTFQNNLDKLTGRKARGTLQGSGDDR